MIFDYDENATKNIVCNANQAPVTEGDIVTGISETMNRELRTMNCYDLQGRLRPQGEASGLNIIRRADGKVVKRFVK